MNDPHQNQLLQLAVDLSPAGMLVVDAAGKILLVNREIERLFGYRRDELIGQPVEMLVPDSARTAHPGHRGRYVTTPEARPMGAGRDLYGRRKDGTQVPVEIGLNPIETAEGLLVLGSVVDITARRAIENQLRQAQKMEAMGTLAGGIAHDFNNLLHGIVGHAELVQRRTGSDRQVRDDVAHIIKIADRGRQLVDRILTFSRQRDVARHPARLERPLREAIELLRATLPRTIDIRETLDLDTPPVTCDETQIHQILVNLGTNAAHAMEHGGVLEIGLAPLEVSEDFASSHPGLGAGPHARLRVTDTGAGMTPEVLERVLEPFFTTKPPGTGTGLGLSMIHGIVQKLGGAIDIASETGRGTRVDVYLPASSAVSTPADQHPADAAWPHILVVEDEKDFAVMLRRQLEAFEYRATVHTSSLDALDDFRARPAAFDALMTDNSMPGMTGLALVKELLRIRPDLPVILVSGAAATTDPAELAAIGVTHVLRKPHTGREMDEALRTVLPRG